MSTVTTRLLGTAIQDRCSTLYPCSWRLYLVCAFSLAEGGMLSMVHIVVRVGKGAFFSVLGDEEVLSGFSSKPT